MNGVTAGIVQHKGFLISIILKRKKSLLLPLPDSHYYKVPLKKRIVSPDSFVSIDSN